MSLGFAVRQGDITIGNLFAETERRQREHGGVFTDVYDFVARVRGWFPEVDFGRNAGPLYEALQPVRLVSPESIRKLIAATGAYDGGGAERAGRILGETGGQRGWAVHAGP